MRYIIFIVFFFSVFNNILFSKTGLNYEALNHNDIKREFIYYVPEIIGKFSGIVFVLHGGGGNPKNIMEMTRYKFNLLSEKYGFIVVYPYAYKKHFNDSRKGISYPAFRENIDDVDFMKRIIEFLSAKLKTERNIYFSGISNGAMMSYLIACKLDNVKGIAAVSAGMPDEIYGCSIKNKLSVMIVSGTKDPLVPYEGGYVKGPFGVRKLGKVKSATETYDFWSKTNGCNSSEDTEELNDPYDKSIKLVKSVRDCGGVSVAIYTVINGGHTWPGGTQYLPQMIVGKTSSAVDITEEIIKFFFKLD